MSKIRVVKGTTLKEASAALEAKPLWYLGVFAIIFRRGRILMVRANGQDTWSLPGGRLEIDDQVKAADTGKNAFYVAISREVLEETGMKVVAVETDTAITRLATKWEDCAFGFFARAEGEPRPLSEIEETHWFFLEEIPKLKIVGPRIHEIISWAFRVRHLFGE
ncbi:MAG: NUDIX domain-containing protein [Candidatus Paceibacterota bacterium]|jgi:ADP-ribose pyrophosphatase YjhB (NUDIX family)